MRSSMRNRGRAAGEERGGGGVKQGPQTVGVAEAVCRLMGLLDRGTSST